MLFLKMVAVVCVKIFINDRAFTKRKNVLVIDVDCYIKFLLKAESYFCWKNRLR